MCTSQYQPHQHLFLHRFPSTQRETHQHSHSLCSEQLLSNSCTTILVSSWNSDICHVHTTAIIVFVHSMSTHNFFLQLSDKKTAPITIPLKSHVYSGYYFHSSLSWFPIPHRKKRDYTLQQGPNTILTGLGFAAYTHTFCGKRSQVTKSKLARTQGYQMEKDLFTLTFSISPAIISSKCFSTDSSQLLLRGPLIISFSKSHSTVTCC